MKLSGEKKGCLMATTGSLEKCNSVETPHLPLMFVYICMLLVTIHYLEWKLKILFAPHFCDMLRLFTLERPSEHPINTFDNHKNIVTVVYINIYGD